MELVYVRAGILVIGKGDNGIGELVDVESKALQELIELATGFREGHKSRR